MYSIVSYLTCPTNTAKVERNIGVEIKSSLFLHPHQVAPVRCLSHFASILIPWAVALTLIAWREKTYIYILESGRGKATYTMIGCLNQSVLPSSSAPAFPFESMSGHYTMHSSGLPSTSVHDSSVELIRWSCTSNIYPSLIFSQSNYQPNARKSLHQRKAQTYVIVQCLLCVIRMYL